MKISDILKSKEITVSCEIFPPKLGTELTQSRKIVSEIANLSPDFISVTYGAAGSTAQFTAELAEEVENCGVAALAHVTCVSSDEESLKAYLETLKANGIENILALRDESAFEICGMFTHFARADEGLATSKEKTTLQAERYRRLKQKLEENGMNVPFHHVCNSAAALTRTDDIFDGVRLGLCLCA